jgi:DNA transformation protein
MSEFVEYVQEVLAVLGEVQVRRMFGGHGVYHDGRMFALVVDEVLYLKADALSAVHFEQRGLPRFEYRRQGRPVQLSYYLAPEEIYDEPDAAREWALLACAAALRGGKRGRGVGR